MNRTLSESERERRAQKIYNAAQWRAWWFGFAAMIIVPFASSILLKWLGLGRASEHMGVFAGVGAVLLLVGPRLWGIQALRRAGLLEEAHEIIARTGAVPKGEAIEFTYPESFWGRLAVLGGFVAFTVLTWCAWRYGEIGWIGAFGFFFFLTFTVLTIATFNQPNIRVDDRGVFGYHRGFWPRLVLWEHIASTDFRRMSGLPTPPFSKDGVGETVILKDTAGKTLLLLNANCFNGATSETKEQIVAEIKRRLTGAD